MAANFEQLLDDNLSTVIMKPGSLVTGIVIDILDNHVVVHVGLKSEAVVQISEFYNESGELELAKGDEVQLTLEAIEDGHGNTRVSREKAIKQEVWKRIEDCLAQDSILKGLITGSVKGGMTVDVQGIKAFLPGSLAEVVPTKDLEHLVGNYEEFKVIKLDKDKNNVVLSRKAVLQEANSEEREKLLATLAEGQVVKGVVKNLTDYGAFVDLGGIDGLLHITDISWSRINHPSEAIKIGEKLDVKIIKYLAEEKKVSLGIKQLVDDPWVGIESKFPLNTSVMATVTNLTDYGFFAEIENGVEGLVHVSEMSWTKKNVHPGKIVSTSQELEVMVLEIDTDKMNISSDLNFIIDNSDILIISIPSPYIEKSLNEHKTALANKIIFSGSKGVIPESHLVITEHLHKEYNIPYKNLGILSGPTHAEEIAKGKLSYLTIASSNDEISKYLIKQGTNRDFPDITSRI